MGFFAILFLLILLSAGAVGLFVAYVVWMETVNKYIFPAKDKRKVFEFEEKVWKSTVPAPSTDIKRFRIQVSDDALDDLRTRLRNTRYGSPLEDVNFTYGFPPEQLKQTVKYWLDQYNWRKHEDFINQHEQFTTNIEGLDIHFIRANPAVADNVRVLPLLISHGWPGSFFELIKLIPLLNKPKEISPGKFVALEVIIPSLPGYGFSEAAQKPGMDTSSIARIFATLMTRLGHGKFFVQGGDWGSAICRSISLMYPERVLGVGLSMATLPMNISFLKGIVAKYLPSVMHVDESERRKLLHVNIKAMFREFGYMMIQATKPNTVGAALSDSPAGLAAYILEKFSSWTNMANLESPDGNLRSYFSMDDLLTNVMIYWVSNSIMSSQRLYKEVFSSKGGRSAITDFPVTVPALLSDFQHELVGGIPPLAFLKPYFLDLIKVSRHPTGGHFASWERPEEVSGDIWMLVTSVLQRT